MALLLLVILSQSNLPANDVEFPLVQALTYFPFTDGFLVNRGEIHSAFTLRLSNLYTFNFERTIVTDLEMTSATFALRFGINRWLTLEFYSRLLRIGPGFMDRFVERFHSFFGLHHGDRHLFPRFSVHYSYRDIFSYSSSKQVVAPLIMGLLFRIAGGDSLRLNGRVALGVPLGSVPGFLSNRPSGSLGLILLAAGGKSQWSFSNTLALFRNPGWLATEGIRNWIFHSELGYSIGRLHAGIIFKSSPWKNGDLANRALQLLLGWRLFRGVEIGIIEEIPPADTVPDFTFFLRLLWPGGGNR